MKKLMTLLLCALSLQIIISSCSKNDQDQNAPEDSENGLTEDAIAEQNIYNFIRNDVLELKANEPIPEQNIFEFYSEFANLDYMYLIVNSMLPDDIDLELIRYYESDWMNIQVLLGDSLPLPNYTAGIEIHFYKRKDIETAMVICVGF